VLDEPTVDKQASRAASGEPYRKVTQVFVGRDAELAVIQGLIDDAIRGRGRLLLLEGEPGIGKTRLAEEAALLAARSEAFTIWGRCWEGEGAPAFWPWVQIVRSYARCRDGARLATELGPGAGDIAQLVPQIRTQLPRAPEPPPATTEPEQARFRLFDSLTTFFTNAARSQPLVMLIDDLHWADRSSLLLLEFLVRELQHARLLVVCAYRDVEMHRDHALKDVLGELSRHHVSHKIQVQGLADREVVRFVESAADGLPAQSLITNIRDKAEGNPFFLHEIVRLWLSEAQSVNDTENAWTFRVPHTVSEAIARRINRLSERCRTFLAVASVIGREFDLNVVRRSSELTSIQLFSALDEAVASRIVHSASRAAGRFRFAHDLIRETLYEQLPPSGQLDIHLGIAKALEQLHAGDVDSQLDSIAHHYSQAAPLAEARRAVDYSVRAGQRAMQLLAYEEAAANYERTLKMLDLLDSSTPAERCEIQLLLGDSLCKAGLMPQAREVFLRVADASRALQLPEILAQAALGLGEPWSEPGLVDSVLVSLLEEALSKLKPGDSYLRVRVLARLAWALYFSPSRGRREKVSADAVLMASRLGDRGTYLLALTAQHNALWSSRTCKTYIAVAEEIARVAKSVGDSEAAARAHLYLCRSLLEIGRAHAAYGKLEIVSDLARRLRQRRYLWQVEATRAMWGLMNGQGEAERMMNEALSIGRKGALELAEQYLCAQKLALRRDRGTLRHDTSVLQAMLFQYPRSPMWRAVHALVQCELGETEEASAAFDRLSGGDYTDIPEDLHWLITMCLLSEICSVVGSTSRAQRLYNLLRPYARRNACVGAVAVCEGSVSRHLGLLAMTTSSWPAAQKHFEDAIKMNSSMLAWPLVARTQLEYAKMHIRRREQGDLEKARELLSKAICTFRSLGMKGCLDKALALGADVDLADQTSGTNDPVKQPRLSLEPGVHPNHAARSANLFRKEGEYWTIGYRGSLYRLRNLKGLQYIAYLVARPAERVHVVDLMRDACSNLPGSIVEPPRRDLLHLEIRRDLGDAGEILDVTAKRAYRERLQDLRQDLDEAERFHDIGTAARLRSEMAFITEQLTAGLRLDGKPRRANSAAERARVNVRNSITSALNLIRTQDKPLWRHFNNALKTGTFCSYHPDSQELWER
jgi:tetratricopeptide (TPR) repeat protein